MYDIGRRKERICYLVENKCLIGLLLLFYLCCSSPYQLIEEQLVYLLTVQPNKDAAVIKKEKKTDDSQKRAENGLFCCERGLNYQQSRRITCCVVSC